MDPFIIVWGLAAAAMAGVGLILGARLLPITIQAYRDLQALEQSPAAQFRRALSEQEAARHGLAKPEGRRRDSSIVGFYGDCLRHKDGAYTRIYQVELEPTMLAADHTIERRTDDLARTLCLELPAGTGIQIRYSTARDPGLAIAEHLEELGRRNPGDLHLAAAQLHSLDLAHYHAMARRGDFRCEKATLAIRVTATHPADGESRGMTAFIRDLVSQAGRYGIRSFFSTLKAASSHRAFRGVLDRLRADEEEAFRKASSLFRRLEMEFPVRIKQLTGVDLWEAIYRSHNLDARSSPRVKIRSGRDLRDYLCADTIEYYDTYAMHGSTPLALVVMHNPPDGGIQDGGIRADCTRLLTARADLSFPHTFIIEYLALDPKEAKAELLARAKQVEQETQKADGRARRDYDARKTLSDLEQLLAHVASSRDALVRCRVFAVVYGESEGRCTRRAESLEILEQRVETIESALKRIEGADVRREKSAALQCLYPGTLLGEMSPQPTYREMQEVATSLAALSPLETAWQGSAHAHTIFATVSGRLIGFSLWDKLHIKSPFCPILGEPGAGKSLLGGTLITDILATQPSARVIAVDFGESLKPLAEALGARYFRLNPEDPRTVNIWDSPELAAGEMPPEEAITLILMHYSMLCHLKEQDERSPLVLTKCIKSVLKNFVRRNGVGLPKREPTLRHLVEKLRTYQFENPRERECAEDLASKLEVYIGDPHLDSPTHPDFDLWSRFDVYELDDLEKFPALTAQTLAGSIAAKAIRSIGKKNEDGEYTPVLLFFDEAHRYPKEFPRMMRVIGRGARQGRKANVVTCVLTHTYDDFEGIYDVTATAGIKIVGLQTGDFSKLIHDAQLSERAVAAINAIRNRDGHYTQWVLVMGTGVNQQVEMVQVSISPTKLWVQTTNPQERNTRERVVRLTGSSTLQAAAWLAERWPHGLAAEALMEIDEQTLRSELEKSRS
jgi:hypothetical protein